MKGVIGAQDYEVGVRISSQTQLNAEPVAEHSLAMIILATKGIFASRRRYVENRAKEETFWENFPDIGLYGAKIGLIGLSRISRRVIEMLPPSTSTSRCSPIILTRPECVSLVSLLSASTRSCGHTTSSPCTRRRRRRPITC